jgi:vacuolar protein sorting-associated protein 13A/C
MQEELSAGLTSIGSDGEAVLQAPSFSEASKSFAAARDSTWQPQQAASCSDPPAGADSSEQQELVRLLFAQYNPNSTNYTGLDVEVVLRLSTLVFYCNRPTVAALMVFGTDLGAVNALLAAPAEGIQVCWN